MEAAERTKNVKYAIRDIAVLAKQVAKKKKVISLNIGDPNRFDFKTPALLRSLAIWDKNLGEIWFLLATEETEMKGLDLSSIALATEERRIKP